MTRTFRTLLLSATALGALATAAAAAPPAGHGPRTDMAGMHATGTGQMHPDMADMAAMHATMMADPAMQAHMADYGIDVEAMQADCPMPDGGATGRTPSDGGGHLGHHGDTPGDDR